MSDQDTGRDDAALRAIPKPVRLLLMVLAAPFAVVLVAGAGLYGLFLRLQDAPLMRFTYNGFALPEHRHRVTYREVLNTEAETRIIEARDLLSDLVADEDWLSLAELAQEWDEGNVYAGAAHALAPDALQAMTAAFSDGYYPSNYCTPIDIPAVRDDAFDIITPLRERHPELPFLAIFEAHLHLMKAWENRGTRASIHVTEAGWEDALKRVEKSKWVVAPLLEQGYATAMLAKLQIGWLAFGCDGTASFRRPFDAYRAADPQSPVPDDWMGNFLLERWYGGGGFDAELRAECERLGARGPEAYVHAYLGQMDVGDEILPGINGAYFAQGVVQLGERYAGDQYALNTLLSQVMRVIVHDDRAAFDRMAEADYAEMADRLQEACAEVLRAHVTAIHPDIFRNPDPMLDLMADALPQAFAAGHFFTLDERGLTTRADQA